MDDGQYVEDDVQTVDFPEEVVGFLAYDGVGEDEDERHRYEQHETRYARQRAEEPVRDRRFVVARKADFCQSTHSFQFIKDFLKLLT